VGDSATSDPDHSEAKPKLLTRLRQRYPLLDWVLRVNERVRSVGGGPYSAAIAMAGFVSLFPLLVVGIAVMGYFSAGDVDFAGRVVDELGLEGDTADTVLDAIHSAEQNRRATTAVGLAGLVWSGLAVASAVEAALNSAWQVKGTGLRGKLRAALWLGLVGLALGASTTVAHLVRELPGPGVVLSLAVALLIDICLLLAMFKVLTNVKVGWRAHLPGAVAGGIGLTLLKLISSTLVPRLVASSDLYGSIGVVFALLAWFLLFARLVVYSAVLNVLTYERDHGTVTAEIQLPHIDGAVALEATRGGAVAETIPVE
jgi:membrane protein